MGNRLLAVLIEIAENGLRMLEVVLIPFEDFRDLDGVRLGVSNRKWIPVDEVPGQLLQGFIEG